MGLFSAGASIIGGLGSIAGGLLGGGGSKKLSAAERAAMRAEYNQTKFIGDVYDKYSSLYNNYYWPIETELAKAGLENTKKYVPYAARMRDYQLDRGDELIQLAKDTNQTLDDNKKNLITRLVEGEDVLAQRWRDTASNDVNTSYNLQYKNMLDNLNQYGINPNSGTWLSQMGMYDRSRALAHASARTTATRSAEDESLNRQTQALNLYTNPTMQYALDKGSPGASISTLLGHGTSMSGASSALNSRQQAASNGSWSMGLGGLGMLGGGLDNMMSLFK